MMKKIYFLIFFVFLVLLAEKSGLAQTTILAQNFEGTGWTPTAYLIGTSSTTANTGIQLADIIIQWCEKN